MRIGFIGLGQMGRGMATRLVECGHELIVWNRTASAAETLAARGAQVAAQPDDALQSDVVITMLADDAAVEAVWLTPDLPRRTAPECVHLNMASVSLALAQRLHALHRASGGRYVSAPVFGRPQVAATGQLDVIAAGDRESLARCVPVFEALARQWFDLGEHPPHANLVKIARNFLLGSIIGSLGEAFALVGKSGVPPSRFLEIITSTSMNAPAFRSYGQLMIENPAQPTFTLKLGLKDIEVALEAAAQTGVTMELAATLREQHLAAIARGYGDADWAALGSYIAESAGTILA